MTLNLKVCTIGGCRERESGYLLGKSCYHVEWEMPKDQRHRVMIYSNGTSWYVCTRIGGKCP